MEFSGDSGRKDAPRRPQEMDAATYLIREKYALGAGFAPGASVQGMAHRSEPGARDDCRRRALNLQNLRSLIRIRQCTQKAGNLLRPQAWKMASLAVEHLKARMERIQNRGDCGLDGARGEEECVGTVNTGMDGWR